MTIQHRPGVSPGRGGNKLLQRFEQCVGVAREAGRAQELPIRRPDLRRQVERGLAFGLKIRDQVALKGQGEDRPRHQDDVLLRIQRPVVELLPQEGDQFLRHLLVGGRRSAAHRREQQ